VKHRATPRFWYCYRRLPANVQQLANGCFELLKNDSRHPSLQFKKVGQFWSARVGLHYRAVAVEYGQDLLWFWIGTHADYDALLRQS
jgi:hypothetical protein